MEVDRPLPPSTDGRRVPAATDATTVEVDETGERAIVRVSGDLDAVAAPDVQAALFATIERTPGGVRVDMGSVDFLDSVGLSVLVAARNRALDVGAPFELAAVPPPCLRVLEITRLTEVFAIVD